MKKLKMWISIALILVISLAIMIPTYLYLESQTNHLHFNDLSPDWKLCNKITDECWSKEEIKPFLPIWYSEEYAYIRDG